MWGQYCIISIGTVGAFTLKETDVQVGVCCTAYVHPVFEVGNKLIQYRRVKSGEVTVNEERRGDT